MHFIDQPPLFHVFCKETVILPLTAANVGCRELEGRQETIGKRPKEDTLYFIILYSSSSSAFSTLVSAQRVFTLHVLRYCVSSLCIPSPL